jgi:hypothetical protein
MIVAEIGLTLNEVTGEENATSISHRMIFFGTRTLNWAELPDRRVVEATWSHSPENCRLLTEFRDELKFTLPLASSAHWSKMRAAKQLMLKRSMANE